MTIDLIVEQRRDLVKDLFFIKKYSVEQIIRHFKLEGLPWGDVTVYRDLKYLRTLLRKEINPDFIKDALNRAIETYEKIILEYWKLYNKSSSLREQALLLRDLANVEKMYQEKLQEFNLLPKKSERHDITISEQEKPVVIIQLITDEVKDGNNREQPSSQEAQDKQEARGNI